MKKIIIAIAALCVAATCMAKGNGPQFGIMGGLTSTNSNVKEAIANYKTINQFHVGACVKLPLALGFVFQPGIEYNLKGATIENIAGISNASIEWKTGYLELPLQLQWGIDLKVIRPYAIFEPFLGYAISNEERLTAISTGSTKWTNVKNRFEYGIGIGAGIEVLSHVQVSVRYFWNLGTVYGADLTIGGIKASIMDASVKGIAATATILF